MMIDDDNLKAELEEALRQEVAARLPDMAAALVALSGDPSEDEYVAACETIRRQSHTLKGAVGVMDLDLAFDVARLIEELFSAIIEGNAAVAPPMLSPLQDLVMLYESICFEPENVELQEAVQGLLVQLASTGGALTGRLTDQISRNHVFAMPDDDDDLLLDCAEEVLEAAPEPSPQPGRNDDFARELLKIFAEEAQDNVAALSDGLLQLEHEEGETAKETLIICMRAAHSLKGSSRAVERLDVEKVCAVMEEVFRLVQDGKLALSAETFDVMHRAVDALSSILSSSELQLELSKTIASALTAVTHGGAAAPLAAAAAEERADAEPMTEAPLQRSAETTVRIATAKLDALMIQAEELLTAKQIMTTWAEELGELQRLVFSWKKRWEHIQPQTSRLVRAPDAASPDGGNVLVDHLEWAHESVTALERRLDGLVRHAEHDDRQVAAMVDTLLEETKQILMLPFATLSRRFPKIIRDLSRDLGKQVTLTMEGEDIEIDRRILHELQDPLVHLLRNCLDHGIESPAQRQAAGKPAAGTITISLAQSEGNKLVLTIADDGGGINFAGIRRKAVQLRLLSKEDAAASPETELVNMIFMDAMSTSAIITDISGRGVGLAVVRERIEQLGGSVKVTTEAGHGTTFQIYLPLTLATFRGVSVLVGEQTFVIPTSNIERVVRLPAGSVQTVENRPVVTIGQDTLSLVYLAEILGMAAAPPASRQWQSALILAHGGQRLAFAVDEVQQEQEVLVKTFGKQLKRVRHYAGATILGAGQVVPILLVADLVRSASTVSGRSAAPQMEETTPDHQLRILVAEDSITSRMLLKNILTSAGYEVLTAVDGAEAFARLRTETVDLLVSDVDMPRMTGFELTANVRKDQNLSNLPVILVTARESREDRERGIDVGANAYIVKSSFDQSNLLRVIQQLV